MSLILRKAVSLFVVIIMLLGVFAAYGSEHAHASAKYALPDKVVEYYYYDGVWDKGGTEKYTYDKKGNIATLKYDRWKIKYKNTYKKGKLVKVKGGDAIRSYKKGRCTREKYGKKVTKFKTNKKGYIIKGTGYRKYKNTVTYQDNGMPSQITYKDSQNTIILKFNADGTVKYRKCKDRKDYSEYEYSYETTDKGITVIETWRDNGKGDWENSRKLVYTIGKKKVSDKRKYVAMINSRIDGWVMSGLMPEHFFSYGNG